MYSYMQITEADIQNVTEELEKAVDAYKTAWPNFKMDNKYLADTLAAVKAKEFKTAAYIMGMADTIVREQVPNMFWVICENLERKENS